MSLLLRLGKASSVYAVTNILQRGVTFLLLPLYTHFLAPDDFGVLSIVVALNAALAVLFNLSLHGAMTRYWFEYRDEPVKLRRFCGTIVSFVLVLSLGFGAILLLVGEHLLEPMLGRVPFWPFAALGVITAVFQPFLAMYLSLLQTREQAGRYAVLTLLHFIINLALTIAFVAYLRMGAFGALCANLAVAAVFFVVALVLLRNEFTLTIDRHHLKMALAYSLPLVPHAAAGQLQAVFDRFVLNGMVSAAAAGLYQVSYLFGGLITIVADAANRAYVPVAMSVLTKPTPESLAELRELGLALVVALCLLAACVGAFAPEIVALWTAALYHEAARAVPVVAFAFVAGGIYYVFVNILFFEPRGTRLIMLGTLTAAIVNVAANLALAPVFHGMGAAVAALLAQCSMAVVVGALGRRYEKIQWPYAAIALAYSGSLAVAVGLALTWPSPTVLGLVAKIGGITVLYAALNRLFWADANHLGMHMFALRRQLGREARKAGRAQL